MKVLVVGSGGREHALAWKLAQSPLVEDLLCAPGNAGIAGLARCCDVEAKDLEGLLALAERERVDLTVVGPERPLIRGIVDRFRDRGLAVFGPSATAARLEGSKAYTNELMARHAITPKEFAVFEEPEPARHYLRDQALPIVVKADGDAFGKGVVVAQTLDEALNAIDDCLVRQVHGPAGRRVVIEECLVGQECTVMAFVDGEHLVPMVPSQDHKRIGEGDTGPNTGGMGCYSPVPVLDDALFNRIVREIMLPTVRAMAQEGARYTGCLYAGIVLTEEGPRLLEYNCRFGDPEAQVVFPRLRSDLAEVLLAAAQGRLDEAEVSWDDQACVCVVLASGGYPGPYEKGKVITGLEAAEALPQVTVFHAGTAARDGAMVTSGGRVLGVTAWGADFPETIGRVYEAVDRIAFDGVVCRRDIARRALAVGPGKVAQQ